MKNEAGITFRDPVSSGKSQTNVTSDPPVRLTHTEAHLPTSSPTTYVSEVVPGSTPRQWRTGEGLGRGCGRQRAGVECRVPRTFGGE